MSITGVVGRAPVQVAYVVVATVVVGVAAHLTMVETDAGVGSALASLLVIAAVLLIGPFAVGLLPLSYLALILASLSVSEAHRARDYAIGCALLAVVAAVTNVLMLRRWLRRRRDDRGWARWDGAVGTWLFLLAAASCIVVVAIAGFRATSSGYTGAPEVVAHVLLLAAPIVAGLGLIAWIVLARLRRRIALVAGIDAALLLGMAVASVGAVTA